MRSSCHVSNEMHRSQTMVLFNGNRFLIFFSLFYGFGNTNWRAAPPIVSATATWSFDASLSMKVDDPKNWWRLAAVFWVAGDCYSARRSNQQGVKFVELLGMVMIRAKEGAIFENGRVPILMRWIIDRIHSMRCRYWCDTDLTNISW